MRQKYLIIVVLQFLIRTTIQLDTYSESLLIYQLANNFYINNFTFNYELVSEKSKSILKRLDYFPIQFEKFLHLNPELKSIELDLVQGRFQENALKKVTQFSNQQYDLPNFKYKEPGLTMKMQMRNNGVMSEELQEKTYGFLSSIFSLGIFEKRGDQMKLTDQEGYSFYYYSKPYEPYCKENLQFLLKHLRSTVFESGISSLLNDDTYNLSPYKHLSVKIEHKPDTKAMIINFDVIYMSQNVDKKNSLESLLQIKGDYKIIRCAVCTDSKIQLATQDNNNHKTLYNFKEVSLTEALPLRMIKYDKNIYSDVELQVKQIESERYVSDLHFAKEGTLFHKIKNNMNTDQADLVIQEYLPNFLRPFIHTAKYFIKDLESGKVIEKRLGATQLSIEYDEMSSSIIKIKNLQIPAQSEILISIRIRKHLNMFEDYPNDPNRGFNIPQMPILFKAANQSKWSETYSKSLLVQTIEPDFSMPFNVNAVTNALLGFMIINTFNTVVKAKRFV
ncbi:gpi transamidase component gpi16 [Stylonychia lemnae]|uniref:Gpi transamidase component gpi16 n=1 Tax=Stylonychia lemnae TaxID=5949 RepID=A0A078AKX8_STYLE|nr:gpi transamidase component gpi16 [Stylonychia lemnae]|eukprot:CDW82854.1 gpi transamidase component gpi16 [Stylonychia lemnae]